MTKREAVLTVLLTLSVGFGLGRSSFPLSAIASVLHGGIPDKQGLIHGCYKTAGGALRVFDPSHGKCGAGEVKLVWGQRGPQGAQGPAGKDAYTRIVRRYILPAGYTCTPNAGDTVCILAQTAVPLLPVQTDLACTVDNQLWNFGYRGCGGAASILWQDGTLYLVASESATPTAASETFQYEAVYQSGILPIATVVTGH